MDRTHIIVFVAGALAGVLLAGAFRSCGRGEGVIEKHYHKRDSTIIIRPGVDREVIRYVPFSRPQLPEDERTFGEADTSKPCPEPYVDSVRITEGRDTVSVLYGFPQRRFAWLWRSAPDTSTRVFDSSMHSRTEFIEDTRRFGVGLYGGYGFDPLSGTWRATVGVGVSWHLLEWR